MEGQSPEYIFQPHPESPFWNKDLNRYVEARLDDVAKVAKPELEVAQRTGQTVERVMYNRLVDLMSEEIADWDNEALREDYRQVENAFGILAFQRFNRLEQRVFIDMLADWRKIWKDEGEEKTSIDLSPQQARILKMVSQRINLPYDESQTNFPFSVVDVATPKRISEIEDPKVTQLLTEKTDDKIGNILKNIGRLSEKQKVKLLLELSKEEFEGFTRRREEGFKGLAQDITADQIPDPVERIRARSRLTYGTPRYEVAAERRRRHIELAGEYPATWDDEFEDEPKTEG